jgi:hypothetical protein
MPEVAGLASLSGFFSSFDWLRCNPMFDIDETVFSQDSESGVMDHESFMYEAEKNHWRVVDNHKRNC